MEETKSPFLTPQELADRWKVTVRTLEKWRVTGRGPNWNKLEGVVRYPLDSVWRFERARTQTPKV